MSTVHNQPDGGDGVGRLVRSVLRYKGPIVAAVLLGALLGYGWAARQPVLYEGVTRVLLAAPGASLPGEAPPPPVDPELYLRSQAELMRSAPVLERAVTLTGNRISAETLGQRLEVDVAPDADVLTVRVVDSTATGAARLADAVVAAYEQFVLRQSARAAAQEVKQLDAVADKLEARLQEIRGILQADPADQLLQAKQAAVREQLMATVVQSQRLAALARNGVNPVQGREPAAVPQQPITPSPGRAVVIGMLLGLLVSIVLVWWRTRRQGPPSSSSAPEQGPELPSPA
jgi:uncharacterized protein involved in exopolysaccharide biosynthesis